MKMDCVDCLRVANANRLRLKRQALRRQILELTLAVDNLGSADVGELEGLIERLLS